MTLSRGDILKRLRVMSDWPEPGQTFFDYTPILSDADTFNALVDLFCEPYLNMDIDTVISVDARGLILAAPIAYALDAGVALVSGKSHMAWSLSGNNHTDQINNVLAMHHDAVNPGDTVILVDDILATGKTAETTASILDNMGAHVVGISFMIELTKHHGRERLTQYPIHVVLNP